MTLAPPMKSIIKKLGGEQGPVLGANGMRSYTQTWVITTTLPLENKPTLDIGQALGLLPKYGDAFDSDAAATATSVEIESNQESPLVKECIAEYSTDPGSNPDQNQDPLQRPSKLSWGVREYETAPITDIGGAPLVNSLGDPLETPLLIPETHAVLTITRNELLFNSGLAVSLSNKVNGGAWLGAAAKTVKADAPIAREAFSDGASYWEVTYRFEYDPSGWIPTRVLNVGRKYKDASGNDVLVPDGAGVLANGFALLDATSKITTRAAPHYLQFIQYFTTDYAVFNLP